MPVTTRVNVRTSGGQAGGCLLAGLGLFVLGLFLAFAYSLFTLLTMVGFWQVAGALVGSLAGTLYIRARIGVMRRTRTAGGLRFAPRAWPALLQFAWQGTFVAYVALLVAERPRTAWELAVAVFYLGVLNGGPLLGHLWRTVRDRNDFALVGPRTFSWRDGAATGLVAYDELADLALVGRTLRFTLGDGARVDVPLARMNIDRAGAAEVYRAILDLLTGPVRDTIVARASGHAARAGIRVPEDHATEAEAGPPAQDDPFALPPGKKPTLH
jgi:hypothetical protein